MTGFYEDDEPVEDVVAAFDRGPKGRTGLDLAEAARAWTEAYDALVAWMDDVAVRARTETVVVEDILGEWARRNAVAQAAEERFRTAFRAAS